MAELEPSPVTLAARRPLSPHLEIYTPMLTMVMSIVHRLTGSALYIGTLLLAWWLVAASSDANSFAVIAGLLGSFIGQVALFGFTWALFTHLLGGIRHMIWDAGYGFDHPEREFLAQATLIGGAGLAVIVWLIAYFLR
jgi:succinate dehydrogenase / fumarate reductase, cytochrome b subunit